MTSIKGLLRTLLGLDAGGVPYAIGVDDDGYLRVALPGQAGSGSKLNPKGKLISPIGETSAGLLKNFQVDANGNLIITLSGGNANEIVKSDGTDAEWDTLANVIEAAILTADGDILIRSGGVVQRLAPPTSGQILGESSQIPAWIAKPAGAYTEGASVYNSADIVTTTAVWKYLTFDSERDDSDEIHSLVSNTERLTCKTAGKYAIWGSVRFTGHATGSRQLGIFLNHTTWIALDLRAGDAGANDFTIARRYELSINDYVELAAFQTSGGNLNVKAHADWTPEFMMQRIG